MTPQQVVEALRKADNALEEVAFQYAWFKGQRDYWKDNYDLRIARAKIMQPSKYGANEGALVDVSHQKVEIPWLEGQFVTPQDMVRLTESSFDLVAKRYSFLENHIGILQSVNRNVLADYQRGH